MIKKIFLRDQDEILLALGVQDRKLRALEKEFKIDATVKYNEDGQGAELSLKGTHSRLDKALARLKKILEMSAKMKTEEPERDRVPFKDNIIFRPEHARPVEARTENQKKYIEAVFDNDLVVSVGPAGTGKTFLACACALRALELGMVERIIVTRPIVEAGEKLGFLGNVLEIAPLAYMRGRTLEKAFIILDEAQNTLPAQMKMFLTRMGINSKMVVNGDLTQIDLPQKNQSALLQLPKILKGVPGVAFADFGPEDVVRHPLVKNILRAYDKWEKKTPKATK